MDEHRPHDAELKLLRDEVRRFVGEHDSSTPEKGVSGTATPRSSRSGLWSGTALQFNRRPLSGCHKNRRLGRWSLIVNVRVPRLAVR